MLSRSSLARSLQTACSASASTSQHIPRVVVAKRNAASISTPQVFPKKVVPRIYPERKRFKVHEYTRLLDTGKEHPLVFFKHTDFSVPRLIQLRKDIVAAALRHAPKPAPAPTSLAGPAPVTQPPPLPQLSIVSTAFFGVALRNYQRMDADSVKAIAGMVDGGLAVLSFPELNPPQLNAILTTLARAVPPRVPKTEAQLEQERKDAADAYVPGRRPKGQKPPPVPELKVVGAIIEGKFYGTSAVQDVAKLPTLDTLRAQIVGLLSAPGAQLAAVLSEASGGKLARTLEGLKKSLEEGQSPSSDAS